MTARSCWTPSSTRSGPAARRRQITGVIQHHDHGISIHVGGLHRTTRRRRDPAVDRSRRLSHDNALAETINGLYKTELIKPRKPWRGVEDVENATAEWVDWFNHQRLFEYCDDLTPVEMETAHYAQTQRPAAG